MGSLQGPVVCPVVRAKQTGVYTVPLYTPLVKATKLVGGGLWGLKGINGVNVANQTHRQTDKMIRCTFSSSSNGNGSMAGNFNENDADYVNSSVLFTLTFLLEREILVPSRLIHLVRSEPFKLFYDNSEVGKQEAGELPETRREVVLELAGDKFV